MWLELILEIVHNKKIIKRRKSGKKLKAYIPNPLLLRWWN